MRLFGSANDRRGAGEIAWAYLLLRIELILSGFDHLRFVLGLLFLVGFGRRLIWTVTAFSVAHSLTLASAALGWVTLRSAPVEASIALSIVLVASEALRERQTLAPRLPALVAFGSGGGGAVRRAGERSLRAARLRAARRGGRRDRLLDGFFTPVRRISIPI